MVSNSTSMYKNSDDEEFPQISTKTVMVNNSTKFNKQTNHFSSPFIKHKMNYYVDYDISLKQCSLKMGEETLLPLLAHRNFSV